MCAVRAIGRALSFKLEVHINFVFTSKSYISTDTVLRRLYYFNGFSFKNPFVCLFARFQMRSSNANTAEEEKRASVQSILISTVHAINKFLFVLCLRIDDDRFRQRVLFPHKAHLQLDVILFFFLLVLPSIVASSRNARKNWSVAAIFHIVMKKRSRTQTQYLWRFNGIMIGMAA